MIKTLPAMQSQTCHPGLIPGLGRSPGEVNGYPLQYSDQENSMDCMEVAKSQIQLSNFHFQEAQEVTEI